MGHDRLFQKGFRLRNKGVSLIEFVIVLLLMALLVTAGITYFERESLHHWNREVTRMLMERLKWTVFAYEIRERRLPSGETLRPMVGRYVAELPLDVWGNPIRIDVQGRLLISYGADGRPGGIGVEGDVVTPLPQRDAGSRVPASDHLSKEMSPLND